MSDVWTCIVAKRAIVLSTSESRMVLVLEQIVAVTGKIAAWVMVPVVLLVFLSAVLRYAFGIGFAWVGELYTWSNGVAVLLAAAYTWQVDRQVRVTIIYDRLSPIAKSIVELSGTLLIVLPTVCVIAYLSWAPTVFSWSRFESSRALDGLPGVFIVKSFILVFCLLIAIQCVVFICRHLAVLRRSRNRA